MAKKKLIFGPLYKIFNVIKSITQSPFQIIKYVNLLNLRTANFLAINRFILLSSGIGD